MRAGPAGGALLLVAAAACGGAEGSVSDPTGAAGRGDVGLPVLSLRWHRGLADTSGDAIPQEFASPGLERGRGRDEARLYVGSKAGRFLALDAERGTVLWKRTIGAVSARPLIDDARIYVGSDDGSMLCLSAADGRVLWRYATRGPILETPVLSGDLLIFANEADQVYALDRATGKFRWQYKGETPEEYTLRGHAGVTVAGDLVFTGFASGTLVALRQATGSVAWLTSLKAEADRFFDVDTTPVVIGELVVAASSAGGLFGIDRSTGLVRWRHRVESVGGITTDGERLYAAAADAGVMALELSGDEIWRQGMRGGGEPSEPVLAGEYLIVSLSDAGTYVFDRATGRVQQYFDPGNGVSSAPTVDAAEGRLYVLSNGAQLYGFALRTFE